MLFNAEAVLVNSTFSNAFNTSVAITGGFLNPFTSFFSPVKELKALVSIILCIKSSECSAVTLCGIMLFFGKSFKLQVIIILGIRFYRCY